MKILFLSRWFPYPTNNGAKLRIFHLLRGLAAVHDVTLLCFADPPKPTELPPELKAICQDIRVVEWKEFQPTSWRALAGLFASTPRALADTFSAEMAQEIRQARASQSFDLIICSEWMMTSYREWFDSLPVLYEEIEVGLPYGHFMHARSSLSRFRAGLTWSKHRRYLQQLLADQQACTVVSELERQILSPIIPANRQIHIIPNCVNLSEYQDIKEEKEENSLIFTGSFRYRPNYEAMVWFLEEVFPLVQAQIPGVCLTITGDQANLPLPAKKDVVLTGYVSDVRPFVARASASVVPLQTGGGTRLKILEAMALGTPVISTPKGAEGLDVEDGRHLLLAAKAEDFALRVVTLLKDSFLRNELAANAQTLVKKNYDWAVVMPRFLDLIDQVAQLKAIAPSRTGPL